MHHALRSTTRLASLAFCVFTCVGVGACAFTAHRLDPRPRPRAEKSIHALVTQVDAEIPDDISLEEALGAPALEVKGWHEALETGLSRGRDGAFQKGEEGAAWRVVLLEAEPRLVVQELDDTGRALLLTAEIAWRARLFDPLMQPVGDADGIAQVPGSFRGVSDASPLLSTGIEILVEQVLGFVDENIARTLEKVSPTEEK